MLTRIRLHQIRCFGTVELALEPGGLTVFTGANAQGKTTMLEAICVLMRLQSPRAGSMAELVRVGESAAAIEGDFNGHMLRVVLGEGRRMVIDGQVVGRGAAYLRDSGLVVWMGNDDIQLVRGGGDGRRRFLDFAASQLVPGYLDALRAYERALRARNFLLKSANPDSRQLAAYASQMIVHGMAVTTGRQELIARLAPQAAAAQHEISLANDTLAIAYADGSPDGLAAALEASSGEERRRRMTIVGPHRDDLILDLHGMNASAYASEGQQRTIALALKVAQARVLAAASGVWPILLLDDIFGELDPDRRHRLLAALPAAAQKLVTTTSLAWLDPAETGPTTVWKVSAGALAVGG